MNLINLAMTTALLLPSLNYSYALTPTKMLDDQPILVATCSSPSASLSLSIQATSSDGIARRIVVDGKIGNQDIFIDRIITRVGYNMAIVIANDEYASDNYYRFVTAEKGDNVESVQIEYVAAENASLEFGNIADDKGRDIAALLNYQSIPCMLINEPFLGRLETTPW